MGLRSIAGRAEPYLRRLVRRLNPGRVFVLEYPVNPRPRWGWGSPVHPELAAIIDGRADHYDRLIAQLHDLKEWAARIPRSGADPSLRWDNDWWGGLDALVHCWLLRERRPATYLEVGSGYSTMFARRAIDDFNLPTRIVSVDPQPRALVDALCDEVIRRPLEDVGAEVVDRVSSGDVVVFDGSHVAAMNSDAVVMLLEILPRLPDDVVLGVDDVFLPADYHPTWAERFYGEQYLLAALLLGGGGGWNVLFPGFHVTRSPRYAGALEPLWPLIETRFGRVASTFWIVNGASDLA